MPGQPKDNHHCDSFYNEEHTKDPDRNPKTTEFRTQIITKTFSLNLRFFYLTGLWQSVCPF